MMKNGKLLFVGILLVLCMTFFCSCSYFSTEDTLKFEECEGGKALSEYEGISTSYEFTLPETDEDVPVVKIEQFVFSASDNLQIIHLSKNLKEISCRSFCNIPNLKQFTVPDENEYFTAVDGVLYNKDMTVLLAYPNGREDKSFVIPDTVTHISECAFYMCSGLVSVTFGQNVTSVGNYAFIKCTNMSTLSLNEGLQELGQDSFSFCDSLTELIVPSSVQKVGDYVFFSQQSKLENFVIYCPQSVFDGVKDWQPRKTAYASSIISPVFLTK